MRLLDVYNFEVQSGFPDQDLADAKSQLWHSTPSAAVRMPKYAILSHRWVGEEVTFQDIQSLPKSQLREFSSRNLEDIIPKSNGQSVQGSLPSIFKIAGACNQVRESYHETTPRIQHIWIDTVCINKADAQELSTSINSMFRWYQNAEVCYVYLVDVSWNGSNDSDFRQQFRRSEWFLRGWTLQELLAPKNIKFFDRDWKYIGSKSDLLSDIASATGITPEFMLGSFRSASLAQKMSWLARRETKFIEDRAYCMLGIFGIYLDARYGQGEVEFFRLQEEILRSWNKDVPFDESLFAWTAEQIEFSGLLAPAPGCFRHAGNVIFDANVAKSRAVQLSAAVQLSSRGLGASSAKGIDIDAAKQITITVPRSIFPPQWVMFLTCGIPAWFTLIPSNAYQNQRQHREMKLNCWTKEPNGTMRAVKIKMERAPDNTWRRVDCGSFNSSDTLKLYPSRLVAMTVADQLRISHEIRYRS